MGQKLMGRTRSLHETFGPARSSSIRIEKVVSVGFSYVTGVKYSQSRRYPSCYVAVEGCDLPCPEPILINSPNK